MTVFRVPLLLAASTGLGLFAALLGTALPFRILGCVGLGVPVLVIARYVGQRR